MASHSLRPPPVQQAESAKRPPTRADDSPRANHKIYSQLPSKYVTAINQLMPTSECGCLPKNESMLHVCAALRLLCVYSGTCCKL